MFRKTVKEYKRKVSSFNGRPTRLTIGVNETIHKETYWFLFIPIYSTEFIRSSERWG